MSGPARLPRDEPRRLWHPILQIRCSRINFPRGAPGRIRGFRWSRRRPVGWSIANGPRRRRSMVVSSHRIRTLRATRIFIGSIKTEPTYLDTENKVRHRHPPWRGDDQMTMTLSSGMSAADPCAGRDRCRRGSGRLAGETAERPTDALSDARQGGPIMPAITAHSLRNVALDRRISSIIFGVLTKLRRLGFCRRVRSSWTIREKA